MGYEYDTKKLFEAAEARKLRFDADASDIGAIERCWVEMLLDDEAFMKDIFIDALCDLEMKHLEEIAKDIGGYDRQVRLAEILNRGERRATRGLPSLALRTSAIGQVVGDQVIRWVEKLVSDQVDQWYDDCLGLKKDIDDGAYGDYLYEQHRDRELDRRADEA
jgi:hypothetical protein